MGQRTVGTLTVDLTAGTSKFIVDLDKANGKVTDFTRRAGDGFRQLGSHSVSSMQATSGAIRLFEGSLPIRSVERFIGMIPGIGDALRAAFPLFGGVAFGGMLVELTGRARDFYVQMESAPARITAAFRDVEATVQKTNDELRVTNDRLANDIAKLEGHRQNTLKLSLDEARVAADNLSSSLEHTLASLEKLLKEQDVGWFRQVRGEAGTEDIQKELFGDETQAGHGGFQGRVEDITGRGQAAINKAALAKDDAARKAAQDQLDGELRYAYDDEIASLKKRAQAIKDRIAEAKRIEKEFGTASTPEAAVGAADNPTVQLAALEQSANYLASQRDFVGLNRQNLDLTGAKQGLEAGKANAKPEEIINARLQAMRDALGEVQAKLKSVGQSDAIRAQNEAVALAKKAVDELNKALKETGHSVDLKTKAEIENLALQTKKDEAELAYQTKLDQTKRSIDDRIKSQEMLTAAIGQGYEATKRAAVETELMTAMGREYNDPARAADQGALRQQLGNQFEAKHLDQVTAIIDKLRDNIELQKALAAVQRDGAEAVRLAEFAYKLDQIAKTNDAESTKKLVAAEKELFAAQQANKTEEFVAKTEEQTAALRRLTAAATQGAEAIRQAQNLNQQASLGKQGGTPLPGIVGLTQEQAAAAGESVAKRQEEISTTASKLVTKYGDQLAAIQEQAEYIKANADKFKDQLAVEIALRDLENQRLRVMAEEAVATGRMSDAMRAFFTEIGTEAEQPGKILYDSMHRAVDDISNDLSKVMTGQKANWGKTFQSLGQQMAKESVDSGIKKGLGKLGDIFPGLKLPGSHSKTGLTTADWLSGKVIPHVIVDNFLSGATAGSGAPSPATTLKSKLPGGLFGGGQISDFVFSLLHHKPGDGAESQPYPPARRTDDVDGYKRLPSGLIDRTGATGPSGNPSDPVWVQEQQQGQQGQQGQKGSGGLSSLLNGGGSGLLGGLFSGGASGGAGGATEAVSSSISFGDIADSAAGFAEGGVTPPNSAYWVGEHGPEIEFNRQPHTVVPMDKLGGGGPNVTMNIDARGSDIGAAGRLRQAQAITYRQAVQTAMVAQREHSLRTPQGRRR